MKTRNKVLLTLVCAVALVAGSVLGTYAYLTSQDTVTNTFTVGKVEITLDEAKVNEYGKLLDANDKADGEAGFDAANLATRVEKNEYKLIPGHTYVKDPTINIADGSEACWLFVKIENGLAPNAVINGLDTNGWTQIESSNYWAYKGATVGANSKVKVFDTFTYAYTVTDTTLDAAKEIVVTAYAIQADGFATSELAWAALATQAGLH